jgi:hypothetical protein
MTNRCILRKEPYNAMSAYYLTPPDGEPRVIPPTGLVIGRGAESHVQLDGPGISRRHAFVWIEAGQPFIRDEASTNGTFVNDRRLEARQAYPLRSGESVRIGNDILRLAVAEAETAAPPSNAPTAPSMMPGLADPPVGQPAGTPRPPPRSNSRLNTNLAILLAAGATTVVLVGIVSAFALGRGGSQSALTSLTPTHIVTQGSAQSPVAAVIASLPTSAVSATVSPGILPLPTATQAPKQSPTSTISSLPDAVVVGAVVNLREGPSTTYAVVTRLAAGDELRVIGQSGNNCGWLKVDTSKGADGWISGDPTLVKRNKPCTAIPRSYIRPTSSVLKPFIPAGGLGELTVQNGGTSDGVVVLARADTNTPGMSAYVRSGEDFKLEGIGDGTYVIFFTTGSDWDGDRFTKQPQYSRFQDSFDFKTNSTTYTTWRITLHPVGAGGGRVENVTPGQFPSAQ